MLRIIQDVIKFVVEMFLFIPMPWRISLILFIILIIVYFIAFRLFPRVMKILALSILLLIEGVVSLILFPEYIFTNWFRRKGQSPLPGSFVFGDVLQGVVRLIHQISIKLTAFFDKHWHISRIWIFILAIVPLILWYVRPSVENTIAAKYIDRGLGFWYSVESWSKLEDNLSEKGNGQESSVDSPTKQMPSSGNDGDVQPIISTPTQRAELPPALTPAYELYVVKEGDTLGYISALYDVSIDEIIESNKGKYPSLGANQRKIVVGWELLIPKK
jgi:LysM repeat protein